MESPAVVALACINAMHIFAWWMAAALAWASSEQESGGGYGAGQYVRKTQEERDYENKATEIERELNKVFEEKETEDVIIIKQEHDDDGAKVGLRVNKQSEDVSKYTAFLCFFWKDYVYLECTEYALLIIYNQPVENVPNNTQFAESVRMIKKGWLPIFRTLKYTKFWEHKFKKKFIGDALKYLYVLEVEVKSTIEYFSNFHYTRTLIIKSTITAGKGITFTMKLDKDQNKTKYTPENLPLLIELIKQHFKPRYFSMHARFNAQIQRIDRLLLLDDAQSSCEEETEHARRFLTTKKSKRRASSACRR